MADRISIVRDCYDAYATGDRDLIDSGDEVVVTYTGIRRDGSRFRNAEIHTVPDDRMTKTEVYFGWDL